MQTLPRRKLLFRGVEIYEDDISVGSEVVKPAFNIIKHIFEKNNLIKDNMIIYLNMFVILY